ncbi:aldo/keto reductase [Burkholderia sola]|uniref:aldo/keto reductase n=1 Tax=Burkholderia sola TaxID=2843302 RepID=UPI001C0A881E|nr:putative aldo/keto reductase family oxidoreductase [Burkholderia cenocepacia]CAG2288521.1 putative aldo/keto reductase family oxidoreductase [Burkholderia cenocepacia]CAG2288929.1 putative aldo/keto reductase family oxidoreductase [Burkholderia cenocepacia]CAG2289041.1 putative aldo/keto reductase family oxidoreductase [Burkholderia cenocepacia]CAG2289127.1 putative aldo/keto reductase family oxidoreductase [Burkholderia cenocepacia]
MTDTIATVVLPNGETIPKLGLGTWEMGERPARRADEIAALREGVELGMTLVDTAEMYGDGATEELVGDALAGLRDDVFLVSKVYPHHASRRGVAAACDASLKRLRTDRLDLYLLHWRGSVPLAETVEGFNALQRAGKIRHWGVSNFDTADMAELVDDAGGGACATNQILYNIARRGPEFDLLPWLADRRIPTMAYSPVDHGRLPKRSPLDDIARLRGVSVTRVALAWVLAQPGVFAIPKASRIEHVRDNRAALDVVFSDDERAQLDAYFRPPHSKRALEML